MRAEKKKLRKVSGPFQSKVTLESKGLLVVDGRGWKREERHPQGIQAKVPKQNRSFGLCVTRSRRTLLQRPAESAGTADVI